MLLFLLVPNLIALDLTTLDGKTYRDCRVSQVYPDSVCVLWPEGGARVKFVNLPESLRAKYGYDEQKAAAFERSEAARQQRERSLLEAQRQTLQSKSRSLAAGQTQPPGAQTPGYGGNTGAQYVGVNMAAVANSGNNQAANQSNGFANGNRRGGAQYVGVRLAGPGGAIYGLAYGPTMRPIP